MKVLCLLFCIMLFPSLCFAEDIYISQTSHGSNTGVDCANSHSAAWFNTAGNWANPKVSGRIGPDDTIHLCGTFTGSAGANMLTFQKSGNAGHPITLLFESDAFLTAPYWDTYNGAISLNGFSNIVVDGGKNGTIMATNNGSSLTYQQNSRGIFVGNPSGSAITIRNMTIRDMYVRSSSKDDNGYGIGIYIYTANGGDNLTIYNNTISDAYEGIFAAYGPGSTNWNLYDNTIYHASTGIVVGSGNTNASLVTAIVHGNIIYDGENWDGNWTGLYGCSSDCWFHNQPVHVWAVHAGSSITGLSIFNNYLYGSWGTHDTAWIYPEGQISSLLIYNNILQNNTGDAPTNGYIFLKCQSGGSCSGAGIYNNTVYSVEGGVGTCMEWQNGYTNSNFENNICYNTNFGIYIDPLPDAAAIGASIFRNNIYYPASMSFRNKSTVCDFTSWSGSDGDPDSAGSFQLNPLLDSNYKPTSASPVIDAGVNLSNYFEKDRAGMYRSLPPKNWDIGAYEHERPLLRAQ